MLPGPDVVARGDLCLLPKRDCWMVRVAPGLAHAQHYGWDQFCRSELSQELISTVRSVRAALTLQYMSRLNAQHTLAQLECRQIRRRSAVVCRRAAPCADLQVALQGSCAAAMAVEQ